LARRGCNLRFRNAWWIMKRIIPTLASVLAIGALALGCGPNPKTPLAEGTGAEFTPEDLANLQDFHAWKLLVPSSQQPFKRITLVLVEADGSSAQLFGTASSDTPTGWTNVLLGFRYEGGVFAGRLVGRGPKLGTTYSVNFTNAATVNPRSWSGRSRFDGNRAELATFWKSDEAAQRGGNEYSILAVELVK
jgi:hypothetical protein